VPHFSCCYKLFFLQAHWGRWCHTHLLPPACLFTVCMGRVPPLHFGRAFHMTAAVTSFPLPRLLGRCCPSCLLWLACLFTVQVGRALSPLSGTQGALPSFSAACVLFSFFFSLFFPGWRSVCPGVYADLFQGCLWEYRRLLRSPGGLLLPSRIEAGIWWFRSPPGFSV
jgi:hypothetical protein